MKKTILAVIVFGMTLMTVAQEAQVENFRLGGTLGLNLTDIITSSRANYKTKAGLRIGVLGEYNFNKWIGVSAELLYSQKGGKVKESFGSSSYTGTISMDYIQIPINAVGCYRINDDFKIVGILGPELGFAVRKQTSYKWKDASGSGKESEKLEGANVFDFGLTFGVGAEYKNIFLRLQYEIGLTNIADNDFGKAKNSCFSISAGYFFWRKALGNNK